MRFPKLAILALVTAILVLGLTDRIHGWSLLIALVAVAVVGVYGWRSGTRSRWWLLIDILKFLALFFVALPIAFVLLILVFWVIPEALGM
jgi:hypothetical protein